MPAYRGQYPSMKLPDFGGLVAPCKGHGELFYGAMDQKKIEAFRKTFEGYEHPTEVCLKVCPRMLARQCLAIAMHDNNIPVGIWGGTTTDMRLAAARWQVARQGVDLDKLSTSNKKQPYYVAAMGSLMAEVLPLIDEPQADAPAPQIATPKPEQTLHVQNPPEALA